RRHARSDSQFVQRGVKMPIPLRDPNQPIPTLPNEQGQMPPAGVPPAPQQAPPPPAPAAPRPGRGKGKKQVEEAVAPKNKKKAGAQAGGSGPIARQDSQNWASDVLKGQFETNPWIKALMDPAALDVRNNPNLQPVIEGIKSELQ